MGAHEDIPPMMSSNKTSFHVPIQRDLLSNIEKVSSVDAHL